jgi:hypothetical protein
MGMIGPAHGREVLVDMILQLLGALLVHIFEKFTASFEVFEKRVAARSGKVFPHDNS